MMLGPPLLAGGLLAIGPAQGKAAVQEISIGASGG
jgi:hypothetical protein